MFESPIYDAKNNFSSLIKKAETGEAIKITRHNKPVAVLLSYEEFTKIKPSQTNFLDNLEKFRTKWHIEKLEDNFFDEELAIINTKNQEKPDHKKLVSVWD